MTNKFQYHRPQSDDVPIMFRLSTRSRRDNRNQFERVKRKLLDACHHPLCTPIQRRCIKEVLRREFREWQAIDLMIYYYEWETISLALRDWNGNVNEWPYKTMLNARRRYDDTVAHPPSQPEASGSA